jgi:hypothetical protein
MAGKKAQPLGYSGASCVMPSGGGMINLVTALSLLRPV